MTRTGAGQATEGQHSLERVALELLDLVDLLLDGVGLCLRSGLAVASQAQHERGEQAKTMGPRDRTCAVMMG